MGGEEKKDEKEKEGKERKGEKCIITTMSAACLLHIPVIEPSLGGGIWKAAEWYITLWVCGSWF